MITISDGILTIPEGERFVGFTGDNLHTQKKFFIRSNTQSGWLYRLYLTFDDGRHNFFILPATVSSEGTFLTWGIEESHILKSGLVKAQIKAFSEEKEVYHTTSDVFVAGKSSEEDEEFKNSNSEFLNYEKTLNELYSKMQTASAKMPYVGENGNWYTYDFDSGAYIDSGVSSTDALDNMIIPPEKLDREYWQKLNRVNVAGYGYFDSIISEENSPNTVYRIEFSGLSPIKSVVGDGSFIAVVSFNQDMLMLLNVQNGEKWIYSKGSSSLSRVNVDGQDIKNSTVTPEKLDREYWQKLSTVNVTGYDYLDSFLQQDNAAGSVFRVEFSGLSPVKTVVGDGSFIAITSSDTTYLYLLNLSNGERWKYEAESYALVKLGETSEGDDFVYIGAFNTLSEMQDYSFESEKVYYFGISAEAGSLLGGQGYCYGRCYETTDPVTGEVIQKMLEIFNSTTISTWRLNLTDTSVEGLTKTGNDGYTPVKGVDYFTEEDKAELVTSVLDSLPIWNGGDY